MFANPRHLKRVYNRIEKKLPGMFAILLLSRETPNLFVFSLTSYHTLMSEGVVHMTRLHLIGCRHSPRCIADYIVNEYRQLHTVH